MMKLLQVFLELDQCLLINKLNHNLKQKVAIIGSGIAGLSSAYFLQDKFDVTLFEKNDYLGGHANTREVIKG